MRSFAIGAGFVLTLCALYGLLDCEDYALLAALMVVTRKVDCITLLRPAAAKPAVTAASGC